jgi:hypothetical protein
MWILHSSTLPGNQAFLIFGRPPAEPKSRVSSVIGSEVRATHWLGDISSKRGALHILQEPDVVVAGKFDRMARHAGA